MLLHDNTVRCALLAILIKTFRNQKEFSFSGIFNFTKNCFVVVRLGGGGFPRPVALLCGAGTDSGWKVRVYFCFWRIFLISWDFLIWGQKVEFWSCKDFYLLIKLLFSPDCHAKSKADCSPASRSSRRAQFWRRWSSFRPAESWTCKSRDHRSRKSAALCLRHILSTSKREVLRAKWRIKIKLKNLFQIQSVKSTHCQFFY